MSPWVSEPGPPRAPAEPPPTADAAPAPQPARPEPAARVEPSTKARRQRSTARRVGAAIVGAVFGFIFGTGLGLVLSQTGTLDMNGYASLVAPVGGTLLGILVGWTGGRTGKT